MIDRAPPRPDPLPPEDAIPIEVDPGNPRPGLQAAAEAIARGRAGVWWVSCHEITLHPEDALVVDDGESSDDIRQWALNLLLTGWLAVATLTLGSAPTFPE